jgi:hypothetical protein
MKHSTKIILVLVGLVALAGCQDINWNWSDKRKRIKPGLSDDVEYSPELWNEVAVMLLLEHKLRSEQASIDEMIMKYEPTDLETISQ